MAPPSVLLVDDQRDIVRLLHSSLQTLGHELEIIDAPSGEEALLEASLRRIDLLVADYLLPGISGVELMHKIRLRNPSLKVIFITSPGLASMLRGLKVRFLPATICTARALSSFARHGLRSASFNDARSASCGCGATTFFVAV